MRSENFISSEDFEASDFFPASKALGDIIFHELSLTRAECNEVYWSVAELIKQPLDKAATR